ncbi:MAG: hypothetical protein ACRDBP_17450, partial [Luteolibacter sp.]
GRGRGATSGDAHSTLGGLKLEWQGAGDIRLPYLGAGWRTYTFDRIIPAGATRIQSPASVG